MSLSGSTGRSKCKEKMAATQQEWVSMEAAAAVAIEANICRHMQATMTRTAMVTAVQQGERTKGEQKQQQRTIEQRKRAQQRNSREDKAKTGPNSSLPRIRQDSQVPFPTFMSLWSERLESCLRERHIHRCHVLPVLLIKAHWCHIHSQGPRCQSSPRSNLPGCNILQRLQVSSQTNMHYLKSQNVKDLQLTQLPTTFCRLLELFVKQRIVSLHQCWVSDQHQNAFTFRCMYVSISHNVVSSVVLFRIYIIGGSWQINPALLNLQYIQSLILGQACDFPGAWLVNVKSSNCRKAESQCPSRRNKTGEAVWAVRLALWR